MCLSLAHTQLGVWSISSGRDSSVDVFLPQIVQLSAGFVQIHVHVHHPSRWGLVEVRCDLIEGLSSCLRDPEECEDEEEEEEHSEDEEDVRPTEILREDVQVKLVLHFLERLQHDFTW